MDPEQQKLERVLTAYTSELSNEDRGAKLKMSMGKSATSNDGDETQDKSETSGRWNCALSLQYMLFGAFYFLTSAALNSIHPYISVYYRQLGLNATQIGIIRSVQSLIAIPWTPVVGYVAAKCSITKKVLVISLFGTAVIYQGLYFIPDMRKEDNCTLLLSTQCAMDTQGIKETGSEHVTTDMTVTLIGSNLSGTCLHPQRTDYNWYKKDDLHRVYMYLILVNIAIQVIGAAWFPLANAIILDALGKEKRNHYAYFKAFGAISTVLSVWMAGLLLDATKSTVTHCGLTTEHANYLVCFVPFSVFLVISIPVAMGMTPSDQDDSINTKEYHIMEVLYSLCNVRHGSVLLTVLWLAIATGKMGVFDNWYIDFLGGSYTLMAWGGLVGQSSLIFTFFALPLLNDTFGHVPVVVIACLLTSIACVISGFISNPVWMIPPIFLREISVAVYMQSSGAYFADVIESHHMASMQAIMSSVTFGMGRGIGSLLGGGLFQTITPTRTYMMFAVVSLAFGLFLFAIHLILAIALKLGFVNKGYDALRTQSDER